MSFKSILTVVTDKAILHDTLEQAIGLTRSLDAHLDVLCLGVDCSQTGYDYAGMNAALLQETLNAARNDANDLLVSARDMLATADIRWGASEAVCHLSDTERYVAARARFCDLAILPQPYGENRGYELEPVVEGALFEGQAPVIVLPSASSELTLPKCVAIAWNESPEALRAVRSCIPLLGTETRVHLVVIDPPKHGPNRSDPGGQVSQFLARHGKTVEVDVLNKSMPRVSDVLKRHVMDIDADMVVMGAYGHSRFRESILGGATRNMLETADVPMFMAH